MKVKYGADRAVESGRGFFEFPAANRQDRRFAYSVTISCRSGGRIFLPSGDNHWILRSSDLILHG